MMKVRRCHCNVNHWHTGGVDLQKASQARLNSLNKSARQLLQPRTTPETKPQRWGFFFGRWPCCGWLAYPWAGGLPGVRAGARVPPDRRTARPWPCRCWLAYPWAGGLPGVRAGAGCCGVPARGPVAVLVGVSGARVPPDRRTARPWPCRCWLAYPVGRVPTWWPCWCRVLWRARPWAGGRAGGRAGARVPPDRHTARPWVCGVLAGLPRGQVACLACVPGAGGRCPWAGCLPGGRAGAGGPTRGAVCVSGARGRAPAPEPVAVLVGVPVPECHQIDARPARGRAGAGWPTPEPVRLPRGQRQPVPW